MINLEELAAYQPENIIVRFFIPNFVSSVAAAVSASHFSHKHSAILHNKKVYSKISVETNIVNFKFKQNFFLKCPQPMLTQLKLIFEKQFILLKNYFSDFNFAIFVLKPIYQQIKIMFLLVVSKNKTFSYLKFSEVVKILKIP